MVIQDTGANDLDISNFAANVGISFKTPEEFFRDEPPQPVQIFDPQEYITKAANGDCKSTSFIPPDLNLRANYILTICNQ